MRTFELHWENHSPGNDDLFPDGIDSDTSLFFHGTSSTREEVIDRGGLIPHAAGVTVEQVRSLVECFDLLGWRGTRVYACPVLRAYTLVNDFRDGNNSPLYLSDHSLQALHFAIPATAGGEKLSACRGAIAELRRFLFDANFREDQIANPENWERPEAISQLSTELLHKVAARFLKLGDLELIVERERERYKYAVIYAIRPPEDARARWEDCRGMGWRVYDHIPTSWFVAKLRVYPPPQ